MMNKVKAENSTLDFIPLEAEQSFKTLFIDSLLPLWERHDLSEVCSFESFEAADSKRNNLQENGNNLQTKVRWKRAQKTYAVLYRELIESKPKEKKKASGKKRARKKKISRTRET